MKSFGYTDIERGEKNSGEEHLTVTQFKILQEEETLSTLKEKDKALTEKIADNQKKADLISAKAAKIQGMTDEEFPDAEKLLPEPKAIESAGAYRKRIIPVISKIIRKARTLFSDNFTLVQKLNRANNEIDRKERKISGLEETIKSKNEEIKLYGERAE